MTTIAMALVLFLCVANPGQSARGSGNPAAQQKPVRESVFYQEPEPPPLSLDELWNAAELVIEGTVVDVKAVSATDVGKPNPVKTDYIFRVDAVFKAHSSLGAATTIALRRLGGTRDAGTYVFRSVQANLPAFEVGEQYVLFLKQNALREPTHYIMTNSSGESVFRVNGGSIDAKGASALARSLRSMSATAFVNLLKLRSSK